MFTLRQSGPIGGDETAMHSVNFDNPHELHTIGQFMDDLLKGHSGDWGSVEVRGSTRPGYTVVSLSYSHGHTEEQFADEILKQEIKSISASGGWSRMDYLIFV